MATARTSRVESALPLYGTRYLDHRITRESHSGACAIMPCAVIGALSHWPLKVRLG
jgi:hypothetical protein